MELHLFKTLWGYAGDLDSLIRACQVQGFDGIEGQAPLRSPARREFRSRLADAGLGYIAEICTGGSYVPDRQLTAFGHLDSLRSQAGTVAACKPLFLTVIAGCDAWSIGESVDFFGEAMAIVDGLGLTVSFETHRSRSFFNPWITRDILLQLPELKLTCDYSHWCVVCERLIDTEPEVLSLCIERAHHIHARVGYDQGPQVPHPAAPQYREALEAHERWWSRTWLCHLARGRSVSTMTPEFGPDGYLQSHPFTNEPAADLDEINNWMAGRQRRRFTELWASTPHLKPLATR